MNENLASTVRIRVPSQIIQKHDLEANWNNAVNFIPQQGEMIVYDQDDSYHYSRIKIGDGVTNVADLPFAALPTIEALDENRLINYGEDEYYFSQTLYDKFRKQNRVYVERGHVLDEETGKWRWRGPYPMYTLSYSAGKLANPWYYKETWYGDYYTANASTLSPTYATKAAFITACKEGTYDIPAPTDDDYPALDSVAQRLGASGNIVVPRTPTGSEHASSKGYVDDVANQIYTDVKRVAGNIVGGRQAFKVNNPGTKAVGINKTGSYIAQSFPLTSEQLKADYYVLETDLYLDTLNWGGSGLQFSLWANNAVVAWFHLNNDYPCMLSNTLAHAENVTFNLSDYAPSADFIHLRLEHHNSETPTITVYINGNKTAEKSFNSGRVGNISSAQLACTGAYKGKVELSNYALINTTEANYQVKPSDWSDFSSFPANEGLVTEQTWGVTTATINPYLAINREGLKTYTEDLLKGNLALGEGTEIGKMKGIPAYGFVTETEQQSIQLSYTTSDNGNAYAVTVTASEPLAESIEVEAAVEWEGFYWDPTYGDYWSDFLGTSGDSRILEAGTTSVTLWVSPGLSEKSYDYYKGDFAICNIVGGSSLPVTLDKTTEHFVVTTNTTAGIDIDDTYSIYQTSPAKTYANVGKVLSIENNKLYVDTLPTLDTPAAGNKYYLMINGKDLGEFIDGHQVVLGQYNEIVKDAALVVGSGTSDTERSNAFVIYEDGRVTVDKEPVESNEIVPKSYVDAQTISLASKQARKVYTPGEKALGITKTGSYLTQELSRTTAQTNAKYSIFEFDLYNDTTVWGGAGLQFSMLAGSTEIAFLMLYNNDTLSMISNNTTHSNNTTFKFADFISNNNYAHIRLEHHNTSTPKVVVYINGRKAAEQTSSIGSGLASKAKITCTKEYKGRVELSNIALINATTAEYEIAEADLLDLSQYPVNEGLATAHKWGITTATTSSLFTVNKLYLDNNNTKVLKQSSAQTTAALNSALTNYVPTLTSSDTHDKLYAEFANNEGRGEYYVTNPDDIIITNRGVPYSADNGYFKSRYPQQTVDWGDDIPETMSKVLYEQYPSGVAWVSTEASSTYKDNRTVLKVAKDAQGEVNSAENINFLAQIKEDGGHKFVFETEISWSGVTGFIAGSGNWCARMHFVADDKTTRMCAVDNDCDITFDQLQTTNNETWFAIGPSAEYPDCYKVASNKTWALLRVEMIDKTLVVFVNDKKVYEKTRDTNLSTFDRSLYGFRIEFRGYTKNTTFYLNNTFVGTVNEDFFGRPSPSIPQRLDNGQINVPLVPVDAENAVSKSHVDNLLKTVSEQITTLKENIFDLQDRVYFLETGKPAPTRALIYQLNNDGTEYSCIGIDETDKTDIIIASEIDGLPVTSIRESAFKQKAITSVTIPDSVTSISDDAFSYCRGLTSVTIGNGVTSIGSGAFWNCSSLTSVYISDLAAWYNISFSQSYSNPLYYAENLYLNGELVTELVIPEGVTEIKNYVFYRCSSLMSVTIPNSVTSIGYEAFNYCYKLVEIINHSSLKITKGSYSNGYVAYYAIEVHTGESKIVNKDGYLFYTGNNRVNHLVGYVGEATELVLPESYQGESYKIHSHAFRERDDIASIAIPDSVTSIGDYAFSGCSGLTSVTIGDSVTSIGDYAFDDCTGLTSVTIPNSVTRIGRRAFYDCSGLTDIYIDLPQGAVSDANWGATNATVHYSEEGLGLSYAPGWEDGTLKITGRGTNTDQDIVIPSEVCGRPVIAIEENAFKNIKINSITIPSTVQAVYGGALCDAAKTVIFNQTFHGDAEGECDMGNTLTGPGPYESGEIYELYWAFEDKELVPFEDGEGMGGGYELRNYGDDTYTEYIYANAVNVEDVYTYGIPWGASKARIYFANGREILDANITLQSWDPSPSESSSTQWIQNGGQISMTYAESSGYQSLTLTIPGRTEQELVLKNATGYELATPASNTEYGNTTVYNSGDQVQFTVYASYGFDEQVTKLFNGVQWYYYQDQAGGDPIKMTGTGFTDLLNQVQYNTIYFDADQLSYGSYQEVTTTVYQNHMEINIIESEKDSYPTLTNVQIKHYYSGAIYNIDDMNIFNHTPGTGSYCDEITTPNYEAKARGSLADWADYFRDNSFESFIWNCLAYQGMNLNVAYLDVTKYFDIYYIAG